MGELLAFKVATPLTDETELSSSLRVSWSRDDLEQISRARESFERYVAKGWIAFSEEPKGRRMIHRFDPCLDKIVLIPPLGGGEFHSAAQS